MVLPADKRGLVGRTLVPRPRARNGHRAASRVPDPGFAASAFTLGASDAPRRDGPNGTSRLGKPVFAVRLPLGPVLTKTSPCGGVRRGHQPALFFWSTKLWKNTIIPAFNSSCVRFCVFFRVLVAAGYLRTARAGAETRRSQPHQSTTPHAPVSNVFPKNDTIVL